MIKKALVPTYLYPTVILNILKKYKINSISHITGGGLLENLPRSIPMHLSVEIDSQSWQMPEIFEWIKNEGNILQKDMYRIFNCGIGMVLVVSEEYVSDILNEISSNKFNGYVIGKVKDKNQEEYISLCNQKNWKNACNKVSKSNRNRITNKDFLDLKDLTSLLLIL